MQEVILKLDGDTYNLFKQFATENGIDIAKYSYFNGNGSENVRMRRGGTGFRDRNRSGGRYYANRNANKTEYSSTEENGEGERKYDGGRKGGRKYGGGEGFKRRNGAFMKAKRDENGVYKEIKDKRFGRILK
ncbi:MAG: hypothetical protein LBC92_03590 [Rickettsiales bacterium]|jgi:hypothetical protein|nr:hypothetical protein [Rickettsiales bacterium]